MQLAPELIAAVVAAVVLAVGLLFLRAKTKRTRNVGRPVSGGPANLRYTCAGCSQQFTHSRRTLGAWEKGTRQFYCNACHTKWRGSHPAQPAQGGRASARAQGASRGRPQSPSPVTSASRASSQLNRSGSGSGCLGIIALLVAVPVAIVFAVSQYA
jgi:hypothetical protein